MVAATKMKGARAAVLVTFRSVIFPLLYGVGSMARNGKVRQVLNELPKAWR